MTRLLVLNVNVMINDVGSKQLNQQQHDRPYQLKIDT